jgi:hypothetical protein
MTTNPVAPAAQRFIRCSFLLSRLNQARSVGEGRSGCHRFRQPRAALADFKPLRLLDWNSDLTFVDFAITMMDYT